MKKQFTLGETERLKSRKLIEQLFKEGRSFATYPFRVYYLNGRSFGSPVQAGFGVSARNMKKAVDRNRVKRLMKEAYRLQKNELQESALRNEHHLSLFFIYTGKEIPEYVVAFEKISLILKRLVSIVHENDSPPA